MFVSSAYLNNNISAIINTTMQIPAHRLPPRDYQPEIIEAYNNPDIDELLLIIGRRGGKTTNIFSEGVVPDLVREKQTIVLVYPMAKMGFRNFWNNIEDDGFKTIEHIPQGLVKRQSNSEDDMRIELMNGSVFMCLGATNVEALRGANGKKYLFDEFVDMPIEAVNVVAPITDLNGGKRVYMGTVKIDGINGGTMKRMHEEFKKDKTKYTCYIQGPRYMTPEQLKKSEKGYITRNGNNFKFLQEVMLDWGQASDTSYYGQIISQMQKDGSIGEYPYNPSYPVYTAWDLGKSDSTAIVFFQYYKGRIYIIDFLETQNFALNSIIPMLRAKPYNYAWHFLPHDGAVHSLNDNVSRLQYLHKQGIVNANTLRREGVSIGIDRVLQKLPRAYINVGMTAELIRKLPIYRRQYNPETGDFIGPDHKSESHAADCIRYMFTAVHYYFDERGDFIINQPSKPSNSLELSNKERETTFYF